MINYEDFIKVVDILGNVEINIEHEEINGTNKVINECCGLNIDKMGNNIEYITNSGNNKFNGYQALAYSRLNKINNCINKYTRQRKRS